MVKLKLIACLWIVAGIAQGLRRQARPGLVEEAPGVDLGELGPAHEEKPNTAAAAAQRSFLDSGAPALIYLVSNARSPARSQGSV